MAATAATAPGATRPQSPARFLEDLEEARRGTLALVASLSEQDLERVHSPIMSPLVWDLGHIAAYEDLWLAHRHGGMELLRPDLADCYDAFETPRAVRGDIEALGADDARAYLKEVRARSSFIVSSSGVGDGVICEMVLRHELQHSETMRQTLAIAGLLAPGDEAKAAEPLGPAGRDGEWAQIPAGPFPLGAAGEAFSYDNERPRHTAETSAFLIARQPVNSASWTEFAQDGGYARREWWSPEGWAWKLENDIAPHPALAASHPLAAACHISWYEADAFARARGARLPTEAEWEKAARWTGPGDEPTGSQDGALAGVGQVWEWTQTRFDGYPGFVAHPYREYSEVFFGDGYRVLRGSSWATHPRVRSLSFRNWDLPQRRQIFAGLRLAGDA